MNVTLHRNQSTQPQKRNFLKFLALPKGEVCETVNEKQGGMNREKGKTKWGKGVVLKRGRR